MFGLILIGLAEFPRRYQRTEAGLDWGNCVAELACLAQTYGRMHLKVEGVGMKFKSIDKENANQAQNEYILRGVKRTHHELSGLEEHPIPT